MTTTVGTKDFFANHEVAVIHMHLNGLGLDGSSKARPPASAIVFGLGVEDGIATTLAGVDACFLVKGVPTGEGPFCAFLAQNLIG